MEHLTALRVRDARQLIDKVDAADITNPDLPLSTARGLIARLKVTVDILAGHAERQQSNLDQLRADKLRAESEADRLRVELANHDDTVETCESIRYTADVVCIRDGHVLMIERGWPPHKGQLALPGGHVDPGETARAAAARELLEETGVRVAPEDLALVGVYDAPDRDPRGRYVTVAYAVTVPAGTTAQAGDDAAAIRWVPLATPGDLAFDHGQIVADTAAQLAK